MPECFCYVQGKGTDVKTYGGCVIVGHIGTIFLITTGVFGRHIYKVVMGGVSNNTVIFFIKLFKNIAVDYCLC